MAKQLNIPFDSELIDTISDEFDLRLPNKEALRQLIFTLNGEYDPECIQVMNLATGVGKTYLMAAFIEYLRIQGVENVVIVTPGKTVQSKTVQNFMAGSVRYIDGAQVPPDVVTPQDYSAWTARINSDPRISYGREIPILAFIFNIQQLIAPNDVEGTTHGKSQDDIRRKPRKFDENAGVLFDYLRSLDDLVVIADESHLYSSSAEKFNAALKELDPAATVGLTASVLPEDHVIFRYPLYQAIQDEYVKAPVLAFRKGGYGVDQTSEEQQLRDALQLREIKQKYYDVYTEQNGLQHLNAVLFVVCADVDHASQVTELLRSPAYVGNKMAVLQVDSQHEDDVTQQMLEDIDMPESPVLVVVSVNKLKEGWDVKNISVVVTLRAMASEVLTQQTMGRGLRLPFKKYTKIRQIDQLDIIAHQSFQELLAAENILSQFGLEEAVSEDNKNRIKEEIQNIVESGRSLNYENDNVTTSSVNEMSSEDIVNESGGISYLGEYASHLSNPLSVQQKPNYGNDQIDRSTFIIRTINDNGLDEDYEEPPIMPIVIERNPDFADVSYLFPVTNIELKQPPIDLAEIDDKKIEEAAKRVTSTGDVLYRKEIVAVLGKKIKTIDVESAEVDSLKIDEEDAKLALIKLVMNTQLVPTTEKTKQYVKSFFVPKFMSSVTFDKWTVKSLESARGQLLELVKSYIADVQRSIKEIPTIYPKNVIMSGYTLQIGEVVYEPIDSRDQFVPRRYYSGWLKSLFKTESFDSYSGEYLLAKLLNTSPHIKWWNRLHRNMDAYIYYTSKDRYFPDFVALDDEGIYWIIEGKNEGGRDEDTVQVKRKEAEKLVRKLAAEESYAGQNWGYLIAYEDDIAKADSWDDLKTLSQPVTNQL